MAFEVCFGTRASDIPGQLFVRLISCDCKCAVPCALAKLRHAATVPICLERPARATAAATELSACGRAAAPGPRTQHILGKRLQNRLLFGIRKTSPPSQRKEEVTLTHGTPSEEVTHSLEQRLASG